MNTNDYDMWTYGGWAYADGEDFSYGGAVSVPEPISMLLLGTGLLGVGVVVRRRWEEEL